MNQTNSTKEYIKLFLYAIFPVFIIISLFYTERYIRELQMVSYSLTFAGYFLTIFLHIISAIFICYQASQKNTQYKNIYLIISIIYIVILTIPLVFPVLNIFPQIYLIMVYSGKGIVSIFLGFFIYELIKILKTKSIK